ncbi:MAG: c-type cytochrome [Pseudomonadales bacterium]
MKTFLGIRRGRLLASAARERDVREQNLRARRPRIRLYHASAGATMLMALAGCGSPSGDASNTSAAHPGEATYTRYCFSCHAAGIAGAPRAGDTEQWAPRLAKGSDALLASTIAGIVPGMPARGLCNQCSDEELANAIDYMTRPRE